VCAIVNDGRRSLAGTSLCEVDADTMAAANDVRRVHALRTQRSQRGIADRVRREGGHERAVNTELRETDRDFGLAAAEGRDERRRLQKPIEPGRTQTQHYFAERDDPPRRRHPRAADTLATSRRALWVMTSKRPLAMSSALSS